MKNFRFLILVFIFSFLIFSAGGGSAFGVNFALANGGNQKVVAGKYVVQLSMAPLVPRAGESAEMIVSIADLGVRPLQEKVFVRAWIRSRGSQKALFDSGEQEILSGNFDFSYKFERDGLYEVFVEFRRAAEPEVVYRPEDFLIAVVPKPFPTLPFVGISLLVGIFIGISFARKLLPFSP